MQISIQQIQQSPKKVYALADKDDEMAYSKVCNPSTTIPQKRELTSTGFFLIK